MFFKYVLLSVLVVSIFATNVATANDWDYSAGMRAMGGAVFGGGLSGTVGYTFSLWGVDNARGPSSFIAKSIQPVQVPAPAQQFKWYYGYIRPSVSLETAGIFNRPSVQVDFFPVRFAGFTLGQAASFMPLHVTSNAFVDCNYYQCSGTFFDTFAAFKTGIGLGKFFLGSQAQVSYLQPYDHSRPYLGGSAFLSANPNYDYLAKYSVFSGYRFTSSWQFLVNGWYAHMYINPGDAASGSGMIGYQSGNWNYRVGGGVVSSSLLPDVSPMFMLEIRWTGKKAVSSF